MLSRIDIVVYQHLPSEIAKPSVGYSLLSSSLTSLAMSGESALLHLRAYLLVVYGIKDLAMRDVEQRNHTPLRLQPILCPLFQCST
jgi:hypothetical protein